MAKKKMTKAQAAAARRSDGQKQPQGTSKKKQQATVPSGFDSLRNQFEDRSGRMLGIFFIILFVVMAIVAPFLVIFVSNLLGISS